MKSFQQWVGLDLKLHEDAVTEQLLLPPPLAQTPWLSHCTSLLRAHLVPRTALDAKVTNV